MLQAKPGRSGKQQQEQNPPNLAKAFKPSPVQHKDNPVKKVGASLNFSANAVPQLLETKRPFPPHDVAVGRAGTTCVSSIAALFPYSWKGLSLAIENNQKVWKSLEGGPSLGSQPFGG